MLRLWAWLLHCSTSLHYETCLFTNRSSSNACIMVLPKLTFVLLCTPFSSPLPHKWRFAVCMFWLWCKTWTAAMLAGVLLMLFFAWNVNQTLEELEAKQKCSGTACWRDASTFISIIGVLTLMIKHSVFSVMTGLIVEKLFMLFSVYNAVWWAENERMWSTLANEFSTTFVCQEIIMVISQKSIRKKY